MIFHFREYLFIKNLNIFEASWTSFLRPFNCSLWVAVLVTMVLLSVSLCLICQCARRHGDEDPQTEALCSLPGSLFAIFTTLCHQGKHLHVAVFWKKKRYRKQWQNYIKTYKHINITKCNIKHSATRKSEGYCSHVGTWHRLHVVSRLYDSMLLKIRKVWQSLLKFIHIGS